MFAALGLVASPAMADPAPTREDIYKQLGVDDVAADYVVLVDTSGSMGANGLYNNVRGVLNTFLGGLAPNDYVALYTFDNKPQWRYGNKAGNRDAILNALPTAPTTDGMTDIGRAIEQALNELNRSGAADIATVVLLTDGEQAAPADSPYVSTTAPAWQNLKTRAASLNKTWLGAYALPLNAKTGASLLQSVIPSTVVLEPSTGSGLAGYLDQSKQATRLAKARSLLAGDVGKGVQVKWATKQSDRVAGTATLELTLTSQTQRAPLTVTDLQVSSGGGVTWSEPPPATVDLKPGQSQTFTMSVRWSPGFSLKLWPHQQDSAPVTATGKVGSPWAAVLGSDIPLNVPGGIPAEGSTSDALSKQVGSWPAVAIAAGSLALIVLVVALILYTRAYPRLPRGTMGVYQVGARTSDGFRLIDRFQVRRRRVEHVSDAAGATIRVRGRRVPLSKFAPAHIGLETTLVRTDIRGTSSHTIRPGHGGLVGGLYLFHAGRAEEVPARLQVSNAPDEVGGGSPWEVPESRDGGHEALHNNGRSYWSEDLQDAPPLPIPGDPNG
ncbi:VWA domain-containing protein [Dactylosporangium sp. NPDC051541]|uniref:vWA domain-containing protein n=1 Tax=Dactylosporangium sp. NPDC051541 TaxID=3363977 RepID=UPI0037B9870D